MHTFYCPLFLIALTAFDIAPEFEEWVNVNLSVIEDDRDVLGWWKGHSQSFPLLSSPNVWVAFLQVQQQR